MCGNGNFEHFNSDLKQAPKQQKLCVLMHVVMTYRKIITTASKLIKCSEHCSVRWSEVSNVIVFGQKEQIISPVFLKGLCIETLTNWLLAALFQSDACGRAQQILDTVRKDHSSGEMGWGRVCCTSLCSVAVAYCHWVLYREKTLSCVKKIQNIYQLQNILND